jgi:hypothetical protein
MAAKKRLGEMLLDAGVIDETQLLAALGHQRKWGGKLGQALIDLKLATEPQIVSALSKKFGYEVAQVAALKPSPALEGTLRLVPRELALRQTFLPVEADSTTLTVAMGDPSNIGVVDELSFRTGRRVKVVIAGDREIAAAIRRLYYADEERRPEAIPLEIPEQEAPLETTRDPFAAMPDHIREGYFGRPAHTVASDPARAPSVRPPLSLDPQRRAAPAQAAPPPLGAQEETGYTPPPVLLRGAQLPVRSPPAAAVPEPAGADMDSESGDLSLGEPILATDLLVDEEEHDGPFEAAPVAATPPPTPSRSALLEALDRLAHGEATSLDPARLAAALARLLLRRGLVTEAELLAELARK